MRASASQKGLKGTNTRPRAAVRKILGAKKPTQNYTCAWTPNSVLRMSLLVYLGATFAFERDSVTGARIPCTCYRSSLPCPRANHWITLLRADSGLHRAYLANQQIIGIHCSEPTEPTLSLPCQPKKQSKGCRQGPGQAEKKKFSVLHGSTLVKEVTGNRTDGAGQAGMAGPASPAGPGRPGQAHPAGPARPAGLLTGRPAANFRNSPGGLC